MWEMADGGNQTHNMVGAYISAIHFWVPQGYQNRTLPYSTIMREAVVDNIPSVAIDTYIIQYTFRTYPLLFPGGCVSPTHYSKRKYNIITHHST